MKLLTFTFTTGRMFTRTLPLIYTYTPKDGLFFIWIWSRLCIFAIAELQNTVNLHDMTIWNWHLLRIKTGMRKWIHIY